MYSTRYMIMQAHWHTSQLPEHKLCRGGVWHYFTSREAEGNGLTLGVGSLWSSCPVSFFCILTRKLQEETTAFLMMTPSFPCPYFPKSSLDPLLCPNKIFSLYPKGQFCHSAALNREGRNICTFSPFLSVNKVLFSTLMNRRKSFFKLESGWSHIYFYIIVVSHLNYLIYISILIYMFLMITWSSICPPEVEVLGYFSLSQTQYERHKLSQCLISR